MTIHGPDCACFYCKDDRSRPPPLPPEVVVISPEPEPFEPTEEEYDAVAEWNEAPTRVDALPALQEAETLIGIPVPVDEFADVDTARMHTFPELAHLTEASARDAAAGALGAMVDAMLEAGIDSGTARRTLARAVVLMRDRRARFDRIPNPKPSAA